MIDMKGISPDAQHRVKSALQVGVPAAERRRVVMLTAYDAISARIAAQSNVDFILVGDSAATTILGYTNTRDVSVDEMLMLTRAVRRGAPESVVIGDLPFGTYEDGDDAAVHSAKEFVKAGADLIKLEGAGHIASRVAAIVRSGIPVVGHVGLLPQGAVSPEDLRAKGRTAAEAMQIIRDAQQLEASGASMIVVEAVPSVVASALVSRITVPSIGIGAGATVSGQVLVYTDVLGLSSGKAPRFVRRYADINDSWSKAVRQFATDVVSGAFPSAAEGYGMPEEESAMFREQLEISE